MLLRLRGAIIPNRCRLAGIKRPRSQRLRIFKLETLCHQTSTNKSLDETRSHSILISIHCHWTRSYIARFVSQLHFTGVWPETSQFECRIQPPPTQLFPVDSEDYCCNRGSQLEYAEQDKSGAVFESECE
jgi:hypothetical protein